MITRIRTFATSENTADAIVMAGGVALISGGFLGTVLGLLTQIPGL